MLVSPIYSSSQGSQQTIIHKQVWLSRLCKKASRNNVVRKPFLKERKTTITEGYKIADLNQLNFVSIGFYFLYFPTPSLSDYSLPPPLPPQKRFSSHSLSLFDALNTMTTRKNGNCFNYYDWGWVNKLFLSKLKNKIEQGPWLRPD